VTDVPGIRVGHRTRDEPGWLTGTTVLLPPPAGATGGVDVRGGAPGTRETDLLDPRNAVDRVHAVVLSGGSALGLATADGVCRRLYAAGTGWRVGGPGEVVPIVPAAILFDLGRGGTFDHAPTSEDGAAAVDEAADGEVAQGSVGAGTGALSGGLKGGVGTASVVLESGHTVGALVAVNSVGSPLDLATGELHAVRHGLAGEFDGVGLPPPGEATAHRQAVAAARAARAEQLRAGRATTIGVVATDARLTKAECQKLAGVSHDGLARAISPVHTAYDGDALFALATGTGEPPDAVTLLELQAAAADCVTRAIGHGLLAATSVDRSADGGAVIRSWRDTFPGATTR
jgi:L-aminopeptidase/D-esterase-like protein